MRVCEQCGADISDRNYPARYCVPCTKDRQREKYRKYREANREKLRQYARRYRVDNPEKARESSRKWHEANPEYDRKYREANRR